MVDVLSLGQYSLITTTWEPRLTHYTDSNVTFGCGVHICLQRCHQLHRIGHDRISCQSIVTDRCAKGHIQKVKCFQDIKSPCPQCGLKVTREYRLLRDHHYQDKTNSERKAQLAEIDQEIRKMEVEKGDERAADRKAVEKRAKELREEKRELESVILFAKNSDFEKVPPPSLSEAEWAQLKSVGGVRNDPLDELMGLIGLEDVKAQALKIKAKIDAAQRQGTDLGGERFGAVLLGNPGTGNLLSPLQIP